MDNHSQTYFYVLNFRFPSDTAHGVYVAQSCNAASQLGFKAGLLAPKYSSTKIITPKILKQLGVTEKLTMVRVLGLDPAGTRVVHKLLTKRFVYQFSTVLFTVQAIVYLLISRPRVVQTGNPEVAIMLNWLQFLYKPKVILDFHIDPPKWLNSRLTKSTALILVNTRTFKNQLISQGIPSKKIEIMPNGVNVQAYQGTKVETLKNYLALDKKDFIVSYVGRFETMRKEKGVFQMLRAIKELSSLTKSKKIIALIVGGPASYLLKYKKYAAKIGIPSEQLRLVDQVPYSQVPRYIGLSSVGWLVYPKVTHFVSKMSPMKVMEYLAAGKPLICSDFPSLRQMISTDLAAFVQPDDTYTQVQCLKRYMQHPDIDKKRIQFASEWSWHKRQEKIFLVAGVLS